jgi:hypothetical protein
MPGRPRDEAAERVDIADDAARSTTTEATTTTHTRHDHGRDFRLHDT